MKCYDNAMTEVIRQSELRNDNAAIMRRVAAGEGFVVTVNGRAVADLTPHVSADRRRRYVPAAEFAAALRELPAPDPAAWRRDADAAERALAPDEPSDPFEPTVPAR